MSLTNDLGCCDTCGKELVFETKEMKRKSNAYQKKYAWNKYVQVCCDECIEKGHTITDEELKGIKKVTIN